MKDKKYLSVYVRFQGVDKPLHKRIKCLSEKTGVSESKISAMAIRAGLGVVAEGLEGMHIDLDCVSEEKMKDARDYEKELLKK